MRTMIKDLRCWVTIVSLCLVAGCVPIVDTPEVDAGDQQPSQDVVFTEDADPAMAILPYVENELLVQPYPGATTEEVTALYSEVGAQLVGELSDIDAAVLIVPPGELHTVAARLGNSGLIETVQKDYLYEASEIPNDPMFANQNHLIQINAAQAWDTAVGAEEIIIAVVDTGVDAEHPDLSDKIIDGWNVYDDDPDFSDVHGHGTMVAGVAAAIANNAEGVTGVAWESPILAVRASDSGGRASARYIAAGILWAAQNGASVINVSFAPLWSNRVVRAAAQQAYNRGSLVVISSGNGGGSTIARGYSEAVFVGAITASDRIASFSDRGPFVDVVAPGVTIHSTARGGEYDSASGTSFAAPIVSGVAALAWSVNPDLRPASIVNIITQSAVDLGALGKDGTFGYGAVDAANAVYEASQASSGPDSTPPTLNVEQPNDGATLSGRYTTVVTATDQSGVADVVLSIDGVPYATDTRDPYRFVIDTRRFPPGEHELSLVATDAAGNVSTTRTLDVTFSLPTGNTAGSSSAITFTSPADGTSVSDDVTIQANVSDSDGLATVEWFVDGQSMLVNAISARSAGVSYLWRTAGVIPGRHVITLIVTDAGGVATTGQLELNTR